MKGVTPLSEANIICMSPSKSLSIIFSLKMTLLDFPGGAVVKNLPANAGATGSIPGPGRSHMPLSN